MVALVVTNVAAVVLLVPVAVVNVVALAVYATANAVRAASAKVYASRASQYSSYAVLYAVIPVYALVSRAEPDLQSSHCVNMSDALLLSASILPLLLHVLPEALAAAPVDNGIPKCTKLQTLGLETTADHS